MLNVTLVAHGLYIFLGTGMRKDIFHRMGTFTDSVETPFSSYEYTLCGGDFRGAADVLIFNRDRVWGMHCFCWQSGGRGK